MSASAGEIVVPDDLLAGGQTARIFEWRDGRGSDAPPHFARVAPEPKSLLGRETVVSTHPASHSLTVADALAAAMIRSDLFLGMSRKSGGLISDSEVAAFIDEEAVPRFPAGTTQIPAIGTYDSCASGVIHEPSRMLSILHPCDPASKAKIHELAAIYCRRFEQEVVLIAMSPALVFAAAGSG